MRVVLLLIGIIAALVGLAILICRFLVKYQRELGSAPKAGGEPTRFTW